MSGIEARASFELKVGALRDAASYPHPCATIRMIETHFACVFLTGDFAYKLKKPVRIERMDFRSLEAREQNCREEVRLNRRMAQHVYLGAVPLTIGSGAPRVDGEGEVVDWLVKMRQLPEQHLLDHAIKTKQAGPAQLRSAALVLADFFQSQPKVSFTPTEYLVRLFARCDELRSELSAEDLSLNVALIDEAYRQQVDFLHRDSALLYARAEHVIEGHGDLRPDHVFLGDAQQGIDACVIDCLEFDRDLRVFDPYEELAFLYVECERLNAVAAAKVFIDCYAAGGDRCAPELFRFYRAARALNRAKIAAWHLRDPSVSPLADWRELAHDYVRIAMRSL